MPNVHCKACNCEITNPDLKYSYYQEDYPSIDIGPYCESCWPKIRVCTECQHPHIDEVSIKYYGNGKYICDDCAKDLEKCDVCNALGKIVKVVGDVHYCESCRREEFFTCPSCGEEHKKNIVDRPFKNSPINQAIFPYVYEDWGGNLCKSCFTSKTKGVTPCPVSECKHCGIIYPMDSKAHKHYCNSCYNSFYQCSDCKDKNPKVKLYKIRGIRGGSSTKHLCKKCLKTYNKCSLCGHNTKFSKKYSNLGQFSYVCDHCHEHSKAIGHTIGTCKACLKVDNLVGSTGMCPVCHSTYKENVCSECGAIKDYEGTCRVCESSRIYNYSFKPKTHFLYTLKDQKQNEDLFFGFENEVAFSSQSVRDRALRDLYKKFTPDILTAKSDSSIQGAGFEIVTQPMTLRYFKSLNVAGLLDKYLKMSSSCGLHVHVNRNFFKSEIHLLKVMQFVYNNEKFIDNVAGRSYSCYNDKLKGKVSKCIKEKSGLGRHQRVNATNSTTIEFRMFQGCVDEYTLRYRIEFIHALCKWSTNTPISKTKDTDSFEKYVADNSKTYPNLYKFLNS